MGRTTYVEDTEGGRYLLLTGTMHPGIRVPTQGATPIMLQFDILKTWLQARTKTDRGASLVEYALLVALIAVVCIVAISFLGSEASTKFSKTGNSISN